jgi:hypothetical protein
MVRTENVSRATKVVFWVLVGLAVLAAVLLAVRLRTVLQPRVSLAQLSPEDRQRLVREALTESPTVFQPAWFEPRIGYTLPPGKWVTAWDDSFVANALGYRAPALAKSAGTFRVVFLGDSWTYGMGIRGKESFPRQLQRLANRQLGARAPQVEAWPLALPGYNTLNEIAALELFFDRLQPDAVVLCPTPNDIDSSNAVTPDGMLARSREAIDDFGDSFSHRYLLPLVDAPSFYRRWCLGFARAHRLELDLRARRIPFFVFFAATWSDALAHSLIQDSGIAAPYAITPAELTVGEWRNPPPFRHGTPRANRRYARYVYELLASPLGWPELREDDGRPAAASGRVFRSPPGSSRAAFLAAARQATEALPTEYVPGPQSAPQCLAPMDCQTGTAPRASGFLVRRLPGATEIVLTLSRLPGPTRLYPLAFTATVADDREAVSQTFVLPENGPAEREFVLRSPQGASAALDVTLLAERGTSAPDALVSQAFVVRRIGQR